MNKIPKIIHYIWIGTKEFSPLQNKCIASWKDHMKEDGWQYKLWNEKTLPSEVINHPYFVKMYERKKWSYVSDFIRFWVLSKEGGIYLDTDVEVLKPFDDLLNQYGFVGKSESGQIESAVIGATQNTKFTQIALNRYTADTEDSTEELGPTMLAKAIQEDEGNITIYSHEYFFPFSFGEKFTQKHIKPETYSIHWWDYSWGSWRSKLLKKLGLFNFFIRIKNRFS